MIQDIAQKYINEGLAVLPLKKEDKGIYEIGWQTKTYTADAFNKDNNIGLNIKPSKLFVVDPDCPEAVYFAEKYLPLNTRRIGVQNPDNEKDILWTHLIFKSKSSIFEDNQRLDFEDGKACIEGRVNGNTVVAPSICESKFFENKKCLRVDNGKEIADAPLDLAKTYNKVAASAALARYIKNYGSNNTPILLLTSCLKHYTDWFDDEIELFVANINAYCGFDNTYIDRVETAIAHFNDKEKPSGGYLALSKKLKVDKEHLKEIFQLIGTVGKDFRKTIINFKERSLSADDFTKEYPEESYLISPIFPEEGLVVLAGKSKIGKSWLVDDMAYAIVNGEEFLGHTCRQGNVLLLALEDGFAKFHVERIKKMKLHIKPNKPTTFVEEVPCIDKGFEESVEQWVNDTPDAKLVIVDTFQKIQPSFSSRNMNAYEKDYINLGKLKKLAHKLKILILYTHHLGQAEHNHSWDKIMGSTGHQGVTDAMYMLERTEGSFKSTFKGTGRAIREFKFDLEFNEIDCRFLYNGDNKTRVMAETKKQIFLAMKSLLVEDEKDLVQPRDVTKKLNLVKQNDKDLIQKTMQRMYEKGELKKPKDKFGMYQLAYRPENITDTGDIKFENTPFD